MNIRIFLLIVGLALAGSANSEAAKLHDAISTESLQFKEMSVLLASDD